MEGSRKQFNGTFRAFHVFWTGWLRAMTLPVFPHIRADCCAFEPRRSAASSISASFVNVLLRDEQLLIQSYPSRTSTNDTALRQLCPLFQNVNIFSVGINAVAFLFGNLLDDPHFSSSVNDILQVCPAPATFLSLSLY